MPGAGALLFGRLAGWFGTQRALIGSLVVWSAVSIYAYQFLTDETQFWLLGAVIALDWAAARRSAAASLRK